MDSEGSITGLLSKLKQGDELAADEICTRCYHRLLSVAHRKLAGTPRRAEDEEDAVQSALASFFVGVRQGQFPRLENRRHLWQLLLTITERKALGQRSRQLTRKRGAGRVRGDSAFACSGDGSGTGVVPPQGSSPTPEAIAILNEDLQVLLSRLDNETLRSVALMKLQGYTNAEIARELDVVERTVERKLSVVRSQLAGLQ